jgi:DNA-binding MarR family transcriptional regulator
LKTDVLIGPAQLGAILSECEESLRQLTHPRDNTRPNWLATHATRSAVKAARAVIAAADNGIGEWGDLPHILRWHRDPNREPAHIRTESADGKVWEAKVTEIKIGSGFNADGSLPDDTALHFWVQFLCPFLRSHTKVLSSAAGAFDFLDRTGDDQTAATERMRAQAADWADCCRVASEIIRTAGSAGRAKLRAFGIAVQLVGQKMAAIDAESEPIIAEHRAEIDRLCADYRDVVQRIESEWKADFGAPYPKDIEDWQRWAARVGWSGERIADGNWKPRDLFPIIEGYLQRLRDQSGGAGDESQPAGLDRNNVAVLYCLSNREPTLQTLDDIVVSAKVSRDTASKALKELIADGLACRPKGERKGATVTDKGRTMAEQIRR